MIDSDSPCDFRDFVDKLNSNMYNILDEMIQTYGEQYDYDQI